MKKIQNILIELIGYIIAALWIGVLILAPTAIITFCLSVILNIFGG